MRLGQVNKLFKDSQQDQTNTLDVGPPASIAHKIVILRKKSKKKLELCKIRLQR